MAPATIEATLQVAGKVVHLGDGSTIPLRVRLGILLARGGIPLHARRLDSRTIRLPMDDSLLLLLVLLCLGDNHKFLHLSSLPQIRPAAHFTIGGGGGGGGVTLSLSLSLFSPPPPPHQAPRLPVYVSSDDEPKPSVVLLLPDEGKGDMRPVALTHRRCHLTTSWASSQSPPSPWPGFYKEDTEQ